jgi:hypothetical protein
LTRAVDGNLVDEGVRTGKIDVLEQARVADRVIGTLAGKQLALLGDIHRFARRHVAQEFKAQGIQRHAFRGHHILGTAIANIAFAQHQRTNAVWIAEGHHAVTDDHRHAGVRAADLAVGRGNRGKNVVCFQRVVTEVIQLAGEILSRISESEVVLMWRRFSSNSFLRSSCALVRLPLWPT